jgi:hypothetical protein
LSEGAHFALFFAKAIVSTIPAAWRYWRDQPCVVFRKHFLSRPAALFLIINECERSSAMLADDHANSKNQGGGFVVLLLRLEFSPSYLREGILENAVAQRAK